MRPLGMFTLHNFQERMFPHITRESPRGVHVRPALGGKLKVYVALRLSDSGSAATIRSVAQAFATFIRNALHFNFEPIQN
jgi:hypothetical protein